MRKRDRERIAKQIYEYMADIDHYIMQQLHGSAWYFENNAEIKGFNFAYGAQSYLEHTTKELKKFLDAEAKKFDKKQWDRMKRRRKKKR